MHYNVETFTQSRAESKTLWRQCRWSGACRQLPTCPGTSLPDVLCMTRSFLSVPLNSNNNNIHEPIYLTMHLRSGVIWYIASVVFACLSVCMYVCQTQGRIWRGRGRGGHVPQSSIEWIFLQKKTGFVGTVLSTISVLWTTMPKMRWRPGLRPDSAGGAHDAPPDPVVGWGGGHPSRIPILLGAFGASILALIFCGPNVKSWLRPWSDDNFRKPWRRKSIFAYLVYLRGIRVRFVMNVIGR